MTLNSVNTREFDLELINCINFNIPWCLDHMSEYPVTSRMPPSNYLCHRPKCMYSFVAWKAEKPSVMVHTMRSCASDHVNECAYRHPMKSACTKSVLAKVMSLMFHWLLKDSSQKCCGDPNQKWLGIRTKNIHGTRTRNAGGFEPEMLGDFDSEMLYL